MFGVNGAYTEDSDTTEDDYYDFKIITKKSLKNQTSKLKSQKQTSSPSATYHDFSLLKPLFKSQTTALPALNPTNHHLWVSFTIKSTQFLQIKPALLNQATKADFIRKIEACNKNPKIKNLVVYFPKSCPDFKSLSKTFGWMDFEPISLVHVSKLFDFGCQLNPGNQFMMLECDEEEGSCQEDSEDSLDSGTFSS